MNRVIPAIIVLLVLAGASVTYSLDNWARFYDGSTRSLTALTEYQGNLYAGTCCDPGDGDILVYNGTNWRTSFNSSRLCRIDMLLEYSGNLYAAAGCFGDPYNATILEYDGYTWSISYAGPEDRIKTLAVHDGKLYAGTSTNGRVLVLQGSGWVPVYNGTSGTIWVLASYNGKLYASVDDVYHAWGRIMVYDGITWKESYGLYAARATHSMKVYHDKLYAGFGDLPGTGVILVFDGTNWTYSFNMDQYTTVQALEEHNGSLYAGMESMENRGDIWAYNGNEWSISYNSSSEQQAIYTFAEYDGKFYAGEGELVGDGNIIVRQGTTPTTSSTTATTSSTTSSTTTTSTTAPEGCSLPGNEPPCETVSLAEVVSVITEWANGGMSLQEVIDLINSWADPITHPPD